MVAASRDLNPTRLTQSDYTTGLQRYITVQNQGELKKLCWDIVQDAIQFIGSKDVSSIMTKDDLQETNRLNGNKQTKFGPVYNLEF